MILISLLISTWYLFNNNKNTHWFIIRYTLCMFINHTLLQFVGSLLNFTISKEDTRGQQKYNKKKKKTTKILTTVKNTLHKNQKTEQLKPHVLVVVYTHYVFSFFLYCHNGKKEGPYYGFNNWNISVVVHDIYIE